MGLMRLKSGSGCFILNHPELSPCIFPILYAEPCKQLSKNLLSCYIAMETQTDHQKYIVIISRNNANYHMIAFSSFNAQ